MSKVENGHLVSIHYKVTNKENGEVLDSSDTQKEPLVCLLGQNQIIPGLENALIGKDVGSKFQVEVAPKDAYGIKDPDFLQEVPKEQFQGIDLKKGMTLFGQSDDGQSVQVIVDEIGETSVMIDYNHPLAGKTLIFDIEILSSNEPSEDEVIKYSSSCCGGGDKCCGGEHHQSNGECGCKH